MKDFLGSAGKVKGHKVQVWSSFRDEAFGHGCGDLDTHFADLVAVFLFVPSRGSFQAFLQCRRQRRAREFDLAAHRLQTRDRHQAGDHRFGAVFGIRCSEPVPQPQVMVHIKEHLRDGVLRPGAQFRQGIVRVVFKGAGAVVPFGERRDTNVKVLAFRHGMHKVNEFAGVGVPAIGGAPLAEGVPGRVAPQSEKVGQPEFGVFPQDGAKFVFSMVHKGKVDERGKGLFGQSPGDTAGAFASGSSGAVGDGDETGTEVMECCSGGPEACFRGVVTRWHEFDGEGHLTGAAQGNGAGDRDLKVCRNVMGVHAWVSYSLSRRSE